MAARQLPNYLEICEAFKVRPGKFRFRGKIPKTAPIVLCGASAPVFAAKALQFVNQSLSLSLRLEEVSMREHFIPNPQKCVPLGRNPKTLERARHQSELFETVEVESKSVGVPPQTEDDFLGLSLRRIRP